MDIQSNINWTIAMRVFLAIFMTKNLVHPDEFWQVNQISYKLVYPTAPMDLPWEFNKESRLRCFIYPLIQAIPMWIMKFLGLDTWLVIQHISYL